MVATGLDQPKVCTFTSQDKPGGAGESSFKIQVRSTPDFRTSSQGSPGTRGKRTEENQEAWQTGEYHRTGPCSAL